MILDKNPSVGALAITSHIANYPGVDKTMGGDELLDKMREQAVSYGTDYRRAQVFMVDVEGEQKVVYTPDVTVKAKTLVLATGLWATSRPSPARRSFWGEASATARPATPPSTGMRRSASSVLEMRPSRRPST